LFWQVVPAGQHVWLLSQHTALSYGQQPSPDAEYPAAHLVPMAQTCPPGTGAGVGGSDGAEQFSHLEDKGGNLTSDSTELWSEPSFWTRADMNHKQEICGVFCVVGKRDEPAAGCVGVRAWHWRRPLSSVTRLERARRGRGECPVPNPCGEILWLGKTDKGCPMLCTRNLASRRRPHSIRLRCFHLFPRYHARQSPCWGRPCT
jgi:hypothetical protein